MQTKLKGWAVFRLTKKGKRYKIPKPQLFLTKSEAWGFADECDVRGFLCIDPTRVDITVEETK